MTDGNAVVVGVVADDDDVDDGPCCAVPALLVIVDCLAAGVAAMYELVEDEAAVV